MSFHLSETTERYGRASIRLMASSPRNLSLSLGLMPFHSMKTSLPSSVDSPFRTCTRLLPSRWPGTASPSASSRVGTRSTWLTLPSTLSGHRTTARGRA